MNKRHYLGFILSILCTQILVSCLSTSNTTSTTETPHQMIKKNQIDMAKGQFQMPSDINALDEDGNTVLHLASMRDDADLVTFFMIKGANPEIINKKGQTALFAAIENDCVEAAAALVNMGADIFALDFGGKTALETGVEKSSDYYDVFINEKTGSLKDSDGKTIVHYFAENKDTEGIDCCIQKKLPISEKDSFGKTPLDIAFEDIDNDISVQIAASLIYGGAEQIETNFSYFQEALTTRNLSTRLEDGQTPLHLGAIMGHIAIEKYLLENNADFSAQDSSGATPLHEAVRYGNVEIASMLLSAGAKVDAKDNLGKTPSMIIIPKNKMNELYSLLISYKANVKAKDMYGDTILHTATMMNADSTTIEMLIKNGCEVNAKNKEGVTPLEIAVQNNNLQVIKLLADSDADIHSQNTHGVSPIKIALSLEENDILEAMINSKNVLSQDSNGNTPLHIALINDAGLSKIKYIVSLTDDVNIRNKNGNAALYYAIMKNRQKVGEILLEKNADIFSTNINNNSPLRLALKYGGSIQDWLITPKTIKATDGSGNTPLHYAAEWEYGNAISSLLVKGCKISSKNANGETPLFSAVKTNNPEIIQMIVDGGADISARDNLGSTPLHVAVRWDAEKSLEKLLALGINVNAQNIAGKSALSEACLTGKMNISTKLLDNGADPNACDTNGVTILMDAIRGQNCEVIKMLLAYGANPNVQEVNGRNAYHEAAISGNLQVIALIRKSGGNPLSRDKHGNTPFSIVMNRDLNTIKEVLGDSLTITDTDGNSPVHIVVKSKGNRELLKFLIENNYPIDTRNADGWTALNLAIERNDVQTALILLENGANPFQMIDKKGRNGITIALDKNDKQMISNIVKYAGELSDVQGNTILHYAAKTCSVETVKTLLSYGIDRNVKNVSGDTPYTIAIRWNRPEIAELLNPAQGDSK